MTVIKKASPVAVSYQSLLKGEPIPAEKLNEAFGPDSLGIIVVKDLPPHFPKLRLDTLLQATYLSKLPKSSLDKLECPEGYYITGWSLGKEKLANDQYDLLKGSYYINCSFYKDPALEGPDKEECEKFKNYPANTTWNKWPNESESEQLEGFQKNCKELIKLIIDVSLKISKNCDRYCVENLKNYQDEYLKTIVKESTASKARLLHYYPKPEEEQDEENQDWCGIHCDHSCLTGLTSALFLKEDGDKVEVLSSCPDAEAGLYIKNRHGEDVKVDIPVDGLAFQTGASLEQVSNGQFKAVPHYVKGTNMPLISRNTLAVFLQPSLGDKVNDTETFAEFSDRVLKGNH
ncbi:unnamed protein product [Ambrosiozyma monospora]|uniref:Unnamed protein product n=1 Tax=Ambrosiozyma monospora TaxID=43982 RepID=A0ACB5SX84_AMBMO|nr:unnamed protein product [Ambrosiozyma monospora]